jgi:hypothetical protein
MTQSTRIYRHSAAGTDWAALVLGAGLGLTLAAQAGAVVFVFNRRTRVFNCVGFCRAGSNSFI